MNPHYHTTAWLFDSQLAPNIDALKHHFMQGRYSLHIVDAYFSCIAHWLTQSDIDIIRINETVVQQFLDGQLYSIDAYVTSRGKVTFCPPVAVKTGQNIGFDDFFGYQQVTPTLLNKESIEEAECIAKKGIHALGLRSTTAHVELLKTEKGWKVVEIGPRIGGFRDQMYKKSFGINHTMNDILVRIPEKVSVPKKVLGHSAALKFFAKKEGILTKLTGIKKVQELESFDNIKINKKVGDRCMYAKNGGQSVFNIMLFNEDRSKLLADIRRLEQTIEIETK